MTQEDQDSRRTNAALRKFFENPEDYSFGIVTQRGYKELEDKFNNHAEDIQQRFRRWFILGMVAFACVALTSSAALVGFGFLLSKQSETTDEIQSQRKAAIRTSCEDQNERHDRTTDGIRRAANFAIKQHPERAEEIRQNTQVSIGLIDLLAPHQDCDALVKRATEPQS